jgi:hypothetical protein
LYQSSACSGVLYVARYLFLNILLGIPLTLKYYTLKLRDILDNNLILNIAY